jgi:hypothetical protein
MNLGDMPPEDEKQPDDKSFDTVVEWLTKELKTALKARKKFSGNIVRRLTAKAKRLKIERDYIKKNFKKVKGNKFKPYYQGSPLSSQLIVRSISFEAPYFVSWPPARHKRLLPDSATKSNEKVYAREVLQKFMNKAFRRPATKAEVDRVTNFFDKIRPTFDSFEGTIKECFTLVLASPEFIYKLELVTDDNKSLNDYELATRLSYLFWSTTPDEELMQLASAGKLTRSEVLNGEMKMGISLTLVSIAIQDTHALLF